MRSPLLLILVIVFHGALLDVWASPSENEEDLCEQTTAGESAAELNQECTSTSSCQMLNEHAQCVKDQETDLCVCKLPSSRSIYIEARRRKPPKKKIKPNQNCVKFLGHACVPKKKCKKPFSTNTYLKCKKPKKGVCCKSCANIPGFACKPSSECKGAVINGYPCPKKGEKCCQDCKKIQCKGLPGFQCKPVKECEKDKQVLDYECPQNHVCCRHCKEEPKKCEDMPGFHCTSPTKCDKEKIVFHYECPQNKVCCRNCNETDIADSCCGKDWVRWGGQCYFISNTYETWEDSVNLCEAMNSTLITMKSQAEMEFLYQFTDNPFWTGMNDRQKEGYYGNQDGTNVTFHNFHPFQPDNWNNEDCVNVVSTYHIHWVNVKPATIAMNDHECSDFQKYVCRKPEPDTC